MNLEYETSMPIELEPRDAKEADDEWLVRNKSLRMDANKDYFLEGRREYHLERYRFASERASGKDAMDAACGTGYGSDLIGKIAKRVCGVDISQEAVDYAQSNYGNEHVSFVKACVERTPFKEAEFDLIASFETLEHTISPQTAMYEFARVLRPEGEAVVSVPNGWGHTKNHFFDFNVSMLKSLIESCFESADFYYHNSGGKKHTGPKGIGLLESDEPGFAECVLAICRQPRKDQIPANMDDYWIDEIYRNGFARHREFLRLYRHRGGLLGRWVRSLKKRLNLSS